MRRTCTPEMHVHGNGYKYCGRVIVLIPEEGNDTGDSIISIVVTDSLYHRLRHADTTRPVKYRDVHTTAPIVNRTCDPAWQWLAPTTTVVRAVQN
jgi:hypothetical protein